MAPSYIGWMVAPQIEEPESLCLLIVRTFPAHVGCKVGKQLFLIVFSHRDLRFLLQYLTFPVIGSPSSRAFLFFALTLCVEAARKKITSTVLFFFLSSFTFSVLASFFFFLTNPSGWVEAILSTPCISLSFLSSTPESSLCLCFELYLE